MNLLFLLAVIHTFAIIMLAEFACLQTISNLPVADELLKFATCQLSLVFYREHYIQKPWLFCKYV